MTRPSPIEVENCKVGREYESRFGVKYPGGTIGDPATRLSLEEQIADMRRCMEEGKPRESQVPPLPPGACR